MSPTTPLGASNAFNHSFSGPSKNHKREQEPTRSLLRPSSRKTTFCITRDKPLRFLVRMPRRHLPPATLLLSLGGGQLGGGGQQGYFLELAAAGGT